MGVKAPHGGELSRDAPAREAALGELGRVPPQIAVGELAGLAPAGTRPGREPDQVAPVGAEGGARGAAPHELAAVAGERALPCRAHLELLRRRGLLCVRRHREDGSAPRPRRLPLQRSYCGYWMEAGGPAAARLYRANTAGKDKGKKPWEAAV